jgi:hypothetical protein
VEDHRYIILRGRNIELIAEELAEAYRNSESFEKRVWSMNEPAEIRELLEGHVYDRLEDQEIGWIGSPFDILAGSSRDPEIEAEVYNLLEQVEVQEDRLDELYMIEYSP